MSNCFPAWSLLYTKPNHEKKLASQLAEKQRPYLMPTTRVAKTRHDRIKLIDMPLFPSYVFVQINSAADYYDCMELEGFCSYVKFGNQLAIVSPKVISEIDLIVKNGVNIEVTAANFQRGENIIITTGPLCGLSGEVMAYKGKERICVRVNLLNRVILADFKSNMLAPAGSGELKYSHQSNH